MNIWDFVDSNFFQTIILIITVIVTIWIYFYQKTVECKEAARMIVMQINSADQRAEQLVRAIGDDTTIFDVDRLWQLEDIIDNNDWKRYRYLFIKQLNYNEIVALNNYYDSVELIKRQQNEIKRMIAEENIHYLLTHLEDSSELIKEEGVIKHIRVTSMYLETVRIEYDKIVKSRDAIPYECLKKIAGI